MRRAVCALILVVFAGSFVASTAIAGLRSDFRGFDIFNVGGEPLLLMLPRSATEDSILISSKLEAEVSAKELDEDTALFIEAELLGLSGAHYEMPRKKSEVLVAIGLLPGNASNEGEENSEPQSNDQVAMEFEGYRSDDEWIELVRVHIEKSLSVSPQTSLFLIKQMAVRGTSPALEPTATAIEDGSQSSSQPRAN